MDTQELLLASSGASAIAMVLGFFAYPKKEGRYLTAAGTAGLLIGLTRWFVGAGQLDEKIGAAIAVPGYLVLAFAMVIEFRRLSVRRRYLGRD